MTLDEAIKHAEEVADKKKREKQKWEKWLESDSDHRAVAEKVSCELCAEEHRQLAEWLKDYKRLKEQEPCEDAIGRSDMLDAIGHGTTYTSDELQKIIKALSLVNPKPKIGRWILTQRDKCIDVSCSECGNTRFKDYACGYNIDELNLEKINDLITKIQMNYCECCGAKMQGVRKE